MVKQRFLEEWPKLTGNLAARHFVLGISGGVDSVVLAHLLAATRVSYSLAHCNFKLRGAASDGDEDFVRTLAAALGVPLVVKSFATASFANDNGLSIQMAARDLRYQWFAELIAEEATCLVTAHHANDVAETLLFNLARGTGLAGLHGIRSVNNKILRPLLWASKEEIRQFARQNAIAWREDDTNLEVKYSRNRLRHLVIPELEKINPAFVQAARRTANRIAEAEALIDHLADSLALTRRAGPHLYIDKEKLAALPGSSTILYRLLRPYGFNYDQVEAILAAKDRIGATFSGPRERLNIDRQELVLSPLATGQEAISIPPDCHGFDFGTQRFACSLHNRVDYTLTEDPQIVAVDWEKLNFPLKIRRWQEGDRFRPLGMQGHKLVSDFLIDEKVPVNLKEEQAVVVSGNHIVWLVGRRLDDRYKLTEHTQQVFEIRRRHG